MISGTLVTALLIGASLTVFRVAHAPDSTAASQPKAPSWRVPAAPNIALPELPRLPGKPDKRIKNVVLLVADDLDWELWQNVPRLKALEAQGTTFTNYVVTDSLCCPSRTSLLRGQYVHNHRVISNTIANGGGWPMFEALSYPQDCLPNWIQRSGANTALVGKYLNEFPTTYQSAKRHQAGWNTFITPMSDEGVYTGFDYNLDVNGTIRRYGSRSRAFLNSVLSGYARTFLMNQKRHQRFFLEFASYNPHTPSPVDRQHVRSHTGAMLPRNAAYNAMMTNPPAWLAGQKPLSAEQLAEQDELWGNRLRSAESIADSYAMLRRTLAKKHVLKHTLIIVTSDNGFHQATRGLEKGKRTAYDTDTVVPLVVIGPGIQKGKVVSQMASETDLGPTIASAMRAKTPEFVDGRSLWPLLAAHQDAHLNGWRTAALSENLGRALPGDPDYQAVSPPKYWALRTVHWLYVLNEDGSEELYDRNADPYELVNIADTAPHATVKQLRDQLLIMRTCSGDTCRRAASLAPTQ